MPDPASTAFRRCLSIFAPSLKPAIQKRHASFAEIAKSTGLFERVFHTPRKEPPRKMKVWPPLPALKTKFPLDDLCATQLRTLDPSGARQKMFLRTNPDQLRVGDILQVRRKNGEPFAGVLLNIRRRGVDTAFLLRNQLTRVGVEMWFKLYSPMIEGVDLVQKKTKRARRAKLYFMRLPKHDMGSVQNIVGNWARQRMALRGGLGQRQQGAKGGLKKKKR